MPPGLYEYKITRGGWDKVECTGNGASIGNRQLKLGSDTVIFIDVEGWQDKFSLNGRKSTASSHVKIIAAPFYIPQLKRTRRIWIYLPDDYNASKKRYPVLYMNDGQNVFEDTTAYSGEWGVDEFLDSVKTTKCIVVAVDHGGDKRLNEYSPYDMEKFGKGEGRQYVDFMVKTLKRYIDKRYRTLPDRQNTFIAGSSMGGLISMYAILRYPKVFGGAGIFSPAFWVAPGIFDEIQAKGSKVRGNLFFYAGKKESETMVPLMIKAFGGMAAVSHARLQTLVRDDGKHNESAWRKEFPLFYDWILR
ncbi:MAG TPA: alpha/beta hydrolase-fold protein [Chitinophagaceae bacterium]|nr:alpha/beta hydrolase-fold protein [Chitinophagaceae bacterium]